MIPRYILQQLAVVGLITFELKCNILYTIGVIYIKTSFYILLGHLSTAVKGTVFPTPRVTGVRFAYISVFVHTNFLLNSH